MTWISLGDAQNRLPEIVEAVASGKEYVIMLDGVPLARMTPTSSLRPRRVFGSAQGLIQLADDFDAPLEDFAPYM